MLFEKEKQIIDIRISRETKKSELWLAIYESWEELKIAWLEKIKTTLERIAFLEEKGFRIYC